MTTHDPADLLRALDPAPERELTAAEVSRRRHLLDRVLADRPGGASAPAAGWRVRPLWWVSAAVMAVVAAAAVVVAPPLLRLVTGHRGGPPLSAADVSSWTSAAVVFDAGSRDGSGPEEFCRKVGDPGDTARQSVVSAELRGRVGSLVMRRGDEYSLCMAGSDGAGFAELLDPPVDLPDTAVRATTGGAHGRGDEGFGYAAGRAGRAVTRIELHVDTRTIDAHVQNGWWTAWWPDTGFGTGAPSPATITTTLGDGTTSTTVLTYG